MAELPKGAKELRKSESGRRLLSKLQEHYKLDIVQPGNPLFEKVYGKKMKRNEEIRGLQERDAEREREEITERKHFEDERKKDHTFKRWYV